MLKVLFGCSFFEYASAEVASLGHVILPVKDVPKFDASMTNQKLELGRSDYLGSNVVTWI
jgi:hypothetical protein